MLEAASFGPGLGATLTIRLPATSDRPTAATDPAVVSLGGIRLLIVDDDPRVRDALAVLLARAGAVVETADSARSARRQVADAAFDIGIFDIAMPDEDGYELLRNLRAGGDTTPAIALTAHTSEADVRRARGAGFELHAAKPIDLELLVANIHAVVAAHRARTRAR